MEMKWLEQEMKYDGTQLSPLFNYLNYGPLGNSIVGWRGACDIPMDHIIDGEDLKEEALIKGDDMLHFVLELFEFPLSSAVAFQRLMGDLLRTQLQSRNNQAQSMERRGDDLYWSDKKFNISIATCSSNSSLIHFGFNVKNAGTPVETCALEDFGIDDVVGFGKTFMESVQKEFLAIKRATMKVRSF